MVAELVTRLKQLGGRTFFYGDVKPIGTEKMTGESSRVRNGAVLQQSLVRLASFAHSRNEPVLVFVDRTDASVRESAVEDMAKAIYSWDKPGMRLLVQVPTEAESHRFGTIQFADWLAASVTRASHFHLSTKSEFDWAPEQFKQIFRETPLRESRIWKRDTRQALTSRGLGHGRPWFRLAATEVETKRSADHCGQLIGELNPALLPLRNRLEEARVIGH